MELFEIEIRNYRCFDQQDPARVTLGPGCFAFVGPNNAGKSSLLRFFYELRYLWKAILSPASLKGMIQRPWGIGSPLGVHDLSEVFCQFNNAELSVKITLAASASSLECCSLEAVSDRNYRWKVKLLTPTMPVPHSVEVAGTRLVFGDQSYDAARILSVVASLGDSIFVGSFRNALNAGAEAYYDLQVGTQFVESWDAWKNGPDKSQNSAVHRATEDIRRIVGLRSLEINASSDRKTLQVYANGRPYRLHELGSGLAQFIITFGAVVTKAPPLVLIDEPELNLHPSLQVDFLTSLGKYAKHGVWFSTHSIGLARATADKVYSLQKSEDRSLVRAFSTTPNYALFLGEMSFSVYQDLGFEKVLLVEGPSEIKTVQQWLRLYGKEHRIVLLPLCGSTLINGHSAHELAELKRITTHVAVLIDSERVAEASPLESARQQFVNDCRAHSFLVHVTTLRATENYLTDNAIKAEKGEKYGRLGPYELLRSRQPVWSKNENWRIAARMTREDLEETDVGKFLEEL